MVVNVITVSWPGELSEVNGFPPGTGLWEGVSRVVTQQ